MALVTGELLEGGVLVTGELLEGGLALALPGDLYVTLPAGVSLLHRGHVTVMAWLSQATAGSWPVQNDCPDEMPMHDSPIVVTFAAMDDIGNLAQDVRRIYIYQSAPAPAPTGAGKVFRFTGGKHVCIGTAGDDISRLIDT